MTDLAVFALGAILVPLCFLLFLMAIVIYDDRQDARDSKNQALSWEKKMLEAERDYWRAQAAASQAQANLEGIQRVEALPSRPYNPEE